MKYIINDEQTSLKINTMKTLKCVKHWMQADIYTDEDLNIIIIIKLREND